MRKLLVIPAVALVLTAFTGCAQQDTATLALNKCVELVNEKHDGDKIDTSDLVPESFTDAMFDAGITDERDTTKTVYAVSGNVYVTTGTTEKRFITICNITVENGKVTDSGITSV